jgi:hypothetical protein
MHKFANLLAERHSRALREKKTRRKKQFPAPKIKDCARQNLIHSNEIIIKKGFPHLGIAGQEVKYYHERR